MINYCVYSADVYVLTVSTKELFTNFVGIENGV